MNKGSLVVFFKQKTAYDMRISDWSSDVCSSDLKGPAGPAFRCRRRKCRLDLGNPRRRQYIRRQEFEGIAHVHLVAAGGVFADDFQSTLAVAHFEIGRASCRARVCQYV